MEDETTVGRGYAFAQLARALTTATEHDDAGVRENAVRRADRWVAVLKGMASGHLRIGSRTPVKDLPAWVTPEVVRGGFATGEPAASGALEPWEAPSREGAFARALTEPGLAEVSARLTSGAYAVRLPEEAALLTIAWLVEAGDVESAARLVEEIAPYADRLRFLPAPAEPDPTGPSVVWRQTAAETGAALGRRQPNARVEAMREALTVWNPFADELLSHWLETVVDDRVAAQYPAGWRERGRALLDRYEQLDANHTRCTKHRKPKKNLAILRLALEEALAGELSPRRRGLLQHAVTSMVARRGVPGAPEHARLRADQAVVAAQPAHHALARIVVRRLEALPQARGLDATEALLPPAADGTPIPRSIRAVVERALAAEPEVLIERGVVPSAEVLAELVPPIAASTVALGYADERLSALMAANYAAFRRRRTLLLLNLEHQVRVSELPWVRAVEGHRTVDTEAEASAALRRLAELALDAFPATIVPSPLVSELDVLAREAGLALPLVEELAADIFEGTFSAKFLRAAQLAGELLEGSLYARYYDIDYAAVRAIDDLRPARGDRGPKTSAAFDALCRARADQRHDGSFVAANGTVIEQAQILTTHNLAALTGPFGVAATLDHAAAARRCLDRALVLAARLENNPRPLRTVKDIAYAWRQLVFFLSGIDAEAQSVFLSEAGARAHGTRLEPVVEGLATLDPQRRLLGWTVGPHWFLTQPDR